MSIRKSVVRAATGLAAGVEASVAYWKACADFRGQPQAAGVLRGGSPIGGQVSFAAPKGAKTADTVRRQSLPAMTPAQ